MNILNDNENNYDTLYTGVTYEKNTKYDRGMLFVIGGGSYTEYDNLIELSIKNKKYCC
jgi:hypothetical protein